MARFVVVGLGTFGCSVVDALMEQGHEVIGVDRDRVRVESMRDRATMVVELDAREPGPLGDQGIGDVDVGVVALGEAFETSVLASLNLRELGVRKVVARARRKREARILEAVGVNVVVCPEEEAGLRLGAVLTDPEIHDWYRVSKGFSVGELDIPKVLHGKSVAESGLRERYRLNLVAIRRKKGPLVVPGPDTRLGPDDRLVLAGSDEDLKAFIEVD